MTRVMVIGNTGGGKSTLSMHVCAAHDLPYTSLDDILWQPGWVRTPEAEFQAQHDAVISGDRWLVDGYGPFEAVEARLEACDTVILVDHPLHIHLWWAAKRQVTSLFFGRRDGPQNSPMWPVTFRLFSMMWWLHREMRPKLIEAVYRRAGEVRIVHLRSPAELNAFRRNPV
jgi:adenylate kinase family enzyme